MHINSTLTQALVYIIRSWRSAVG